MMGFSYPSAPILVPFPCVYCLLATDTALGGCCYQSAWWCERTSGYIHGKVSRFEGTYNDVVYVNYVFVCMHVCVPYMCIVYVCVCIVYVCV